MIRPRAAFPLGTLSRRSRLWWRRGAFAVVFIVACLYPVVVNNGFVLDIATDMALWAVLAIGLNAVLGWAGLLDLGYIAFFALGGYTYAILSSMHIMSFWPSLVVGLVISAIAAVIIGVPTLRLHSDYLAIMTLGFGLIVYVAAENLNITGGDNGLFGYPPPRIGSLVIDSPLSYYLLAVALTVVALAVAVWVRKSRLGRAWLLLHADETAASSVGIPVYRYKLYAYMFGSIWGTLSGALFAVKETIVSPISFDWTESFFVVAAVVIGGTGSIAGCVVGGVVYVFISEAIGGIDATLSGVIFAGAMLGFILLRPRGLVPARREYRDGGRSLAPRPLQLSVAPLGAPDVPLFVGAPQDAAAERAVSLRAEGVTVRFGGVQAVDGVSVAATNGTVLALIGSNGAGKTTFLNAISGLAPVREGRIFARLGTRDVDLTRLGARARARFGIGRTFQSPRLARDLTVWENVLQGTFVPSGSQSGWRGFLGMSSSSDSGRRRTADALALVGLSGKGDEIAGDLPYGDQRRCEIGRSVASDPSFILMDEPSSGMNDVEAKAIVELVRTLAARGIGVVIVEHNMNIVRAVADTVVAMDLGRVIAQGTPEAVLDDPVVRGRFLGE